MSARTRWRFGLAAWMLAFVASLYGTSFALNLMPWGVWYNFPTAMTCVCIIFGLAIATVNHLSRAPR